MRRFKMILILLAVLLLVFFSLPKHIGRYFYWNYAGLNDHNKFPKRDIKKGDTTFYFTKPYRNYNFEIPGPYKPEDTTLKFEAFLESKKSVAFLVAKNDVLIYEKYFDGYDSASIIPSFSTSKVFVTALVGIAIDEGYIYSTGQPITFFLKELGPEFDKITIEDLLNMRSGIDFNESYSSPFADMAKY
ncbi:MAG: beta-lactamase family protein, partial [Bacteroidales bacterium]|nr:beta-lactamase family protein [Bacteroidales bacterium]